MRVGIIGITGMLGHHTAIAAQAAGHDVVGICRQGSDLSKIADLGDIEIRHGTLGVENLMQTALDGLDGVINCAGWYPTLPITGQQAAEEALCEMRSFYAACKHNQLKHIVYVGASIALPISDTGVGHADLQYDNQPTNQNPYLQAKYALDKLALDEAAAGMPVCIAIPAMTFGEYDYGPTTGQLITRIANDDMPGYVKGNRNAIYAGDAGRGLVLALEKGKGGERYLLTGHNANMDVLTALIAKVTGKKQPKKSPLWLAKWLNRRQTKKWEHGGPEPAISETAIAIMSAGQHLDGSKAETELGFKAEVSLEDAINKAYVWFKQENFIEA